MTTFEIHLNRSPDLFRRFGDDGGFQIGDPLEFVHGGAVVTDESEAALLDAIFELYNTCHPPDYQERSLSVGDVVKIEGRFFACQAIGWTRISNPYESALKAFDEALEDEFRLQERDFEAELFGDEEGHAEEKFGYHGAGTEYYDDFGRGLGELDCGGI